MNDSARKKKKARGGSLPRVRMFALKKPKCHGKKQGRTIRLSARK